MFSAPIRNPVHKLTFIPPSSWLGRPDLLGRPEIFWEEPWSVSRSVKIELSFFMLIKEFIWLKIFNIFVFSFKCRIFVASLDKYWYVVFCWFHKCTGIWHNYTDNVTCVKRDLIFISDQVSLIKNHLLRQVLWISLFFALLTVCYEVFRQTNIDFQHMHDETLALSIRCWHSGATSELKMFLIRDDMTFDIV